MKTRVLLMGLVAVLCFVACKKPECKPCECTNIQGVAYNQTIYPDLYFGMDMACVRQILDIDTGWIIAEDTLTYGGDATFYPGDTVYEYHTTLYCGLVAWITLGSTLQGTLQSLELKIPYNTPSDSIQLYRNVWKERVCDIYGDACSEKIETAHGWIDIGNWIWNICGGPSCSLSILSGDCTLYNHWNEGEYSIPPLP